MKKAFQLLFILLILATGANAQNASQPAFNAAVDRINCETIRFIHREAGRAEIANNMECFSFESILKSVPDDEASTTQKVSKDIEAYKSKFSADKDLGGQLDAVITYAARRIKAKPRKFNVSDFEAKLQEIKQEALTNANAGGTPNNNADQTANTTTEEVDDNEEDAVVETQGDKEPAEINWLGWLSIFLGGAALIFAFLAYRRADEALNRGITYMPSSENGNNQIIDNSAEIRNLENKFQRQIEQLNADFDDKIASITASTGYTAPEINPHTTTYTGPVRNVVTTPVTNIVEEDEPEEEEIYIPTPVDQADAPDVTEILEKEAEAEEPESFDDDIEEETDEISEVKENTEERVIHTLDDVEEEATSSDNNFDNSENEIKEEIIKEEPQEEENEIIAEDQNVDEEIPEEEEPENFRSDASATIPPVTPMAPVEEDEEAEGLPQYFYTGLPNAEGNFEDSDFSEAATSDAIYEVEMYDDVPNKAFIAPLQTPEAMESAMANVHETLAPCCEFTNEPAGKEGFIVVEEGILRKENGHWHIYQKAKIRFD